MNRHTIVITTVLIAIIVLVLSLSYMTQEPSPAARDTIRVGAPGLEQNALIYVASDIHYFAKNGLDVVIRDDYPTGVGPVNDMGSGVQDISVSAEYPVISNILSGGDISIIASIDKYVNEELIARKETGIKNLTDLKGKRIGLPKGTILEFFLGRLLELNGIRLSEVTLININTTHAGDAITGGEVDAIMYFRPHTTRIIERLGGDAVVWPAQSNQLLYAVAAARNDWIRGHPDELRRFLLSLAEAEDYTKSHPDETKEILMKRLNMSDRYITSIWPDHQFSVTLDQSLLVALVDEGRWAIINNMTTSRVLPDFKSHFSLGGLRTVRPGSVNIR